MGPRLRGDDGDDEAMVCFDGAIRAAAISGIDVLIHMSNSHGQSFPRCRAR